MEQLVPERLAVRVKACRVVLRFQSLCANSCHIRSVILDFLQATVLPTNLTNVNPSSIALRWYAQLNI